MIRFTALLILCISTSIHAQPTTVPTTAPAHRVKTPIGFQKIAENGYDVICEEADVAWIRAALAKVQAPDRPTTLPGDLLNNIEANRAKVIDAMMADLAMIDRAKIEAMIDQKIIPMAQAMRDLNPRAYFIVTTRDRMKEAMRAGWEDPRFYYNRLADEIVFDNSIRLNTERADDETVLPALYKTEDSPALREKMLTDTIRNSRAGVLRAISQRSQFLVQLGFVQFLSDEIFSPMDLPAGQTWIGLGVTGVMTAKYQELITGRSRADIIAEMTREDPRSRVKAHTIDLLNPTDPKFLRAEFVPAYIDAMRRKSVVAINAWVKQSGDDAVGKILTEMKTTKPETGEALIKLIQEKTGFDASSHLAETK